MPYPTSLPSSSPATHQVVNDEVVAIATATNQFKTIRPATGLHHWASRVNATNVGAALNRLHYYPILVLPGFTYTRIGCRVSAAAGAGGVIRLGIYDQDTVAVMGDKLVDGGTVASDTTGVKTATISFTPTKSVYVFALLAQVSITGLTMYGADNNTQVLVSGVGNDAGENQGYTYQDGVSGALPTTPTPVVTVSQPFPLGFLGVA